MHLGGAVWTGSLVLLLIAVRRRVIDDDPVVAGDLVWAAGPSPVVVGLLIVAALVLAGLVAWRFAGATHAVVAGAALLAAGTALGANLGLPPGMDVQSVPVVLGVLALGPAALGALLA